MNGSLARYTLRHPPLNLLPDYSGSSFSNWSFIVMKKDFVWAFEYCACVYESDFSIQSLHSRAVSAYKAMTVFRDQSITKETWEALPFLGYFLYPHGPRNRGGKPDWKVRIRKIEVLND